MTRRKIKRNKIKFDRFILNTPAVDILSFQGEPVTNGDVVTAIQTHIEKSINNQYFLL